MGWRKDGATLCNRHLVDPKARAKAVLRAEVFTVMGFRRSDVRTDVDLIWVVQTMIDQALKRADGYAAEIERLVAESPSLRDALVGDAYGEGGKTGEYIRGIARLEAEERDRAMGWAFKALAVGIEAKRADADSRHGELIAGVLRALLGDTELGLTDGQRAVFPAVLRRHLGLTPELEST